MRRCNNDCEHFSGSSEFLEVCNLIHEEVNEHDECLCPDEVINCGCCAEGILILELRRDSEDAIPGIDNGFYLRYKCNSCGVTTKLTIKYSRERSLRTMARIPYPVKKKVSYGS